LRVKSRTEQPFTTPLRPENSILQEGKKVKRVGAGRPQTHHAKAPGDSRRFRGIWLEDVQSPP
jgi:hypothetical protein